MAEREDVVTTKDGLTCEQNVYAGHQHLLFIMREQPEAVLKRLEQAVLRATVSWSRPSLIPKCASGLPAEGLAAPRAAG